MSKDTDKLPNTDMGVETAQQELQRYIDLIKSLEDKLKRVRQLHATMSHHFPDVMIGILNKEMHFGLIGGNGVSDVDLSVFGVPEAKAFEDHFLQLDESTLIQLKKAFEGEPVFCEVKTKDRFYNVKAIPLRDSKNYVGEILCVIQNVTEQKRMEEGLLSALEKEKELGELKSRFVTMASHEFRTPLTAILASTFLLESYHGDDYDKEKVVHTSRIKRSVNNLTTILNEFLSLEKLEANKVSVVHSDVNIVEYIQDDLVGEMELVKKSGQSIEYKHTGHAMFHLDHHLLWSIVTNLISNSLKYSKPDDKIRVTTENARNTLTLRVEDSGIGIPEDEQKNIFGRFYRARNALNIEGTGLGLHIAQKYVHLLNGTIKFNSRLDEGTTFTVVLPDGKTGHPNVGLPQTS